MRKAIGLIRVSTEAQAREDRAGLAAQRAEAVRIAQTYDLEIVRWAELRGVSGTRVLEDPRFQDVLQEIENPSIRGVIVADMDRLMRPDDPGYYRIFGQFRDTETVIYTSNGPKDFRQDRLLMMIEAEVAALERDKIRDRTMRAKESHRRAGRHVAGPIALPYAIDYRNERLPGGGIEPIWSYRYPEAERVRRVFDLFLDGERNFSSIAKEVGIPRTQVRRILQNPIYAGIRRIDHRGSGGRRIRRRPEDVIETVVIDRPLVDPNVWRSIQPLLDERRRDAGPEIKSPCVYRGFTVCGGCGKPMHIHRDRPWSYRCKEASRRNRACPTGSIRFDIVDEAADKVFLHHIAQPAALAQALEAALVPIHSADPDPETLKNRIADLRRERIRVVESFERGLRTADEAERRANEIEQDIALLERSLDRSGSHTTDVLEQAQLLAAPFAEWSLLSAGDKRKILSTSVRSVNVIRAGRARARIPSIDLLLPSANNVEKQGPGSAGKVTGRGR